MDKNWKEIERRQDGSMWFNKTLGLAVIRSENVEKDGKNWIHVSVSRRSKVPSYDDLKLVKKLFIGDDLEAYQVFPKKSNHVNIHEYCLHLWATDSGPVLPDFTHGTGSI